MKRISPGTVTVVVLALVCGLVAAYVVRQSLTPKPEVAEPAPAEETVGLVLARNNLPVNTLIRPDDVQLVRVPKSKEPAEGFMRRSEVAVGRIVKATVKAGQVMREEYLLDIGQTLPGLAERIPAGHRALTITVENPSGNELIDAGSLVDIAMSVEGDHPDLGELSTRTLMRAVEVVEVAPHDRRRNNTSNQLALTVAVTPKDANKLITAEQSGMLTVTLCSVQDGQQPLLDGDQDSITRKELLGLRDIPAPPVPPAPPAPPQPYRVEQWRGNSRGLLELAPEETNGLRQSATAAESANPPSNVSAALIQPRVVGPPSLPIGQ